MKAQHITLLTSMLLGTMTLFYTFYYMQYFGYYHHHHHPRPPSADDFLHRNPVLPNRQKKVVMVTGAAGFIGYHLSAALATGSVGGVRHKVVAIDNFNDYYDVNLKHARAKELLSHGIEVQRVDVCNETMLRRLLNSDLVTHVVHLAAQAGVRYSIKDPIAYITSNVECFTKLLVLLDQFPTVKLLYASTSSVYGADSSVPFTAPWPPPGGGMSIDAGHGNMSTGNTLHISRKPIGNIYAATKLTNEMLATVHCSRRRHNIASQSFNLTTEYAPVGLRFFTVYGPWGRPDMALYGFANAMVAGENVVLFKASNHQPMTRDFTYIDDIISGIIMAIDYTPVTCGEVFNLGRGSPASVPDMIRILEKKLNITAKIKEIPSPATELMRTFANISESELYLNFKPKIDLEQGIQQFVEWYRSYHRTYSTVATTV